MFNTNKKRGINILKSIFWVLLINTLFLHGAYAADLFTPQPGSLATTIGLPLFAPETSPFQAVLVIFDSATLLIAGLIAFYNMVLGVATTAHDGEMLGKTVSTVFTPIRFTVAFAFMIPMGGGFSPVQYLAHQAGVQGSGLADAIWAVYTPTALRGTDYVPPQTNERIKEVLKTAVESAVCSAVVNQKIDKIADQGNLKWIGGVHIIFGPSKFTKSSSDGTRIIGYNWGNTTGFNSDFPASTIRACGTTQLVLDTPNFNPDTKTTSLTDLQALASAMQNVQTQQMDYLVSEAKKIGDRIVLQRNYTSDDALADMTRVSQVYSDALKEQAKVQFNKVSLSSGVLLAQQDGWMGAGSWALKISNTQTSANSIVNNIPRSQFGEDDVANTFINQWDNTIFATASAAGAKFELALKQDPTSPKSRSGSNDAYSQQLISGFVSINKDLNNVQIDYFSSNPMVVFGSIGNNFLTIANNAAITATTASVVSAIPFFGNVLTTIAAAFGTAFSMMFWAVIIPGLYLSYFVQMVPFFMFSMAVAMWFILMGEALFASQLWAMMFVTADKGSLIGEQNRGLSLLYSLTMRPPLYIIGLIIAISIQTPLFNFINREYINLLANLDGGDHFVWQQIGYGFAYITLVHTLMMKIWQIPLDLPEHIESWMNVQGSGSVASLKGASQEAMAGTNSLTGAAVPIATGAIASGAHLTQSMHSSIKEASLLKKQEEMKKKENTNSASNGDDTSNEKINEQGKDISKFTE